MASTFLVPKNNANSKLSADITAIATTLTVQSGEGARFPSTYPFNITIDNEILKVTNRSTDTMTVTRAQESTTAATHKAGANVQLNITAKAISDLNTAVNALEAAPPAHKTSHQSGGSDAIKLDDLSAPDDNTDLDVSTTKHGLTPKLPNDSTKYLNGVGSWAVPAGGSGTDKSARVYHNVDQSCASGSWVTLAFNSERFDTDTVHDTVTNNSRLNCKTAGKYLIIALVFIQANATGERHVKVVHNGTTSIAYTTTNAGATMGVIVQAVSLWDMAVNDYVEVQVYQNSGSSLNAQYSNAISPEFMMIKIA